MTILGYNPNHQPKQRNNMKRIPRPAGLTLIAQQLGKGNKDENLIEKLFSYILHNKLQINGQVISLKTLGTLLNIPEVTVYKRWMNYQSKLSDAFLGMQGKGSGAFGFFCLEATMAGYAQTQAQLGVLSRSQGGQYKPYISSSLNEAIGQNTAMIRTMLDMYKAIKPSGPNTALQINNYTSEGTKEQHALKTISINEAMNLLDEQGINKIGYDESLYPEVKAKNLTSDIPEVRATHQDMSKSDAMPILLPTKVAGKSIEGKASKHTTRRVDEEGIDSENDI